MSVIAATLALLQAQGFSATNVGVDVPMAAPRGHPAWHDEFGGTALDRGAWRFDTTRNRDGWYNNEKQYHAEARPENTRVADGHLTIETRHEALSATAFPDWSGQGSTSAKLVAARTTGYGFYEVRAKLPCGRGLSPAIWLLPDGRTWPAQGEIDIMEMVGHEPGLIHATLHTALFNHAKGTQRGSQATVPSACTDFHRYQLGWRPGAITIGVDDRAYMRVRNDQPGGRSAWPFDAPLRLILNVVVGGDWGGEKGIDDAALPPRMEVDYVRIWTR